MSLTHAHHHDHEFDDDEWEFDHGPIDKPHRDPGKPVKWYRTRIAREDMSALNRKSDLKGFAQTLGFLGVIAGTGTGFVLACFYAPWYVAAIALLVHGACCSFLINGFHELVHESVFKTRWLNSFFLYILSFFGWWNPVHFWASHTEHHKFTLHPPDDLEAVLPMKMTVPGFIRLAIFDFIGFRAAMKDNFRHIRGGIEGEWESHLFPPEKPELRRAMFNWARIMVAGHLVIAAVTLPLGLWPIFVATSLSRFIGNGLHYLCNAAQHMGMVDHVPDFRLCCRTIHLAWPLRFLYWHMNYHTEHHMYAGVPCYNLAKLHRLIRHDLPTPPRGLYQTWKQIAGILRRQKLDPTYQYLPKLPPSAHPAPVSCDPPVPRV